MEQIERPFELISSPENGCVLIATKDLKPLDIILIETPVIVAPDKPGLKEATNCIVCLKELDSNTDTRCPGCGLPICDQNCVTGSVHQSECGLLTKLGGSTKYQIIAEIRLLLVQDQKQTNFEQLVKQLERTRKLQVDNNMERSEVVNLVKEIWPSDDSGELVNNLVDIVYSYSISYGQYGGRGVYPVMSLVQKCCVANAIYTINMEDFSLVLRAKTQIEEGEEIKISNISPVYGQPKRRHVIMKELSTSCQCSRCSDVTEFGTFTSALKCSHCREGLILPESLKEGSIWRCRFCSDPYDTTMIENKIEDIEDEFETLCKSDLTVKLLETFIRKKTKDLYMKHYINLMAQMKIIEILALESSLTREMAVKMVRYCKSYSATMSRLDPGLSEWLGFVVRCLNEAQLQMLNIDLKANKIDRNSFAEESEDIWKSMNVVQQCDILCKPVKTYHNS